MNNITQACSTFLRRHKVAEVGIVATVGFALLLFVSASLGTLSHVLSFAPGGGLASLADAVDSTELRSVDLATFNPEAKITGVTDDEKNYYVDYTYDSYDIQDNTWGKVVRTNTLTVSKEALGETDLGLYVQKQIGEVLDYQLNYLKQVQVLELAKVAQAATKTQKYAKLIGLTLGANDSKLEDYTPVVAEPTVEEHTVSAQAIQNSSSPVVPVAGDQPVVHLFEDATSTPPETIPLFLEATSTENQADLSSEVASTTSQ